MKKRYAWLLSECSGKIYRGCGSGAVLRVDKRNTLLNSLFDGIKHLNMNSKVKYMGVAIFETENFRDHCSPLCYWIDGKYSDCKLDINM